MPQPTSSLATLRPDLAGSLEEFNLQADRAGFVGLRVLPVFEAPKSSDTFGVIPLEQLLQNQETTRASGSPYQRGEWTFTTKSFTTQENGWEEPVDDREAQLYRDYFDAEVVSAKRAEDFVLRRYERRVAAAVFNATTFTKTDVSTEWSTGASATPIADVKAARLRIWAATGIWPNAIVMNRKVFLNLRECDELLDKVSSVERVLPGDIGVDHLRAAFDVDQIIVAGSAQNTANQAQSASISSIWSDEYVGIGTVATSNDLREPCVGRTFHWGEDGSQIGGMVESYRDERVRSDIIRVRMDTDENIIYPACWQLLGNITA